MVVVIVHSGLQSDWLTLSMLSSNYSTASLQLIHSYLSTQRERMQNYTAPVEIVNTTVNYLTPHLPETPLYQEVSGDLGPFFLCVNDNNWHMDTSIFM